jgi:hypothetical protein
MQPIFQTCYMADHQDKYKRNTNGLVTQLHQELPDGDEKHEQLNALRMPNGIS